MDIAAFEHSLGQAAPPPTLGSALAALWWDAKGDWARAHQAAQSDKGTAGAWVHAYLHRKEGNLANAGTWYRRAGRAPATGALDAEWRSIAGTLLARG
ncbi:MAG: hypothetical protein ACREER_01075 [Alphaproteobacteria bacterium]